MNLPVMNGAAMKAVRQSQKRSAEEIAELMGMSRNSLLALEKSDVVPIQHVKAFMEALEIDNDELFDLLENLQALKQQESEKNSEFTLDPKKMESYIFDNFKKNLGSKEITINNLQSQNDKLKEKIQEEQLGKILLKTELDKIEVKYDNLRSEVADLKRWVENVINQKAEKIEKDLEQVVKNTLDAYSKQIGETIKENESSGLGDFIEKSGLNTLISNPAFGNAIGQMIANAINPAQNQVINQTNFEQNMGNHQGFSGNTNAGENQFQEMSGEHGIGQ